MKLVLYDSTTTYQVVFRDVYDNYYTNTYTIPPENRGR